MLPSVSRGLRLALVLALGAGYVAWPGHVHPVYAEDGDDDEDDEAGDDEGEGDDEEGDDEEGDDEEGDDEEGDDEEGDDEDEEDEDDKDQPAVTAGGLFTLATYPVSEILRPLTITRNIAQVRVSAGTDVSAKGAFGSGGLSVEGQYGVADNFMVIGGLTNAYNFKQFSVYAGFEGALIYDLVDIRLAANLHRSAIPELCNKMPSSDACGGDTMPIPSGDYDSGDIKFSIDLGFPFRYALKPEIAIVALQTLMSIDFNSAKQDYVQVTDGRSTIKSNDTTPDLIPSIGIATNPIPQLSLVAFAQLRIIDFDTSAGAFQVPVTGRVQFSPSQKLDVGLEFTLLNVMPPEGQSPIDNRFLSLFVQSRFGR